MVRPMTDTGSPSLSSEASDISDAAAEISWAALPDDVLLAVLRTFPVNDLLSAGAACK